MPTLAEICTDPPITIALDASLESALERLLLERVGELYVTDADGRLLGIVPDYELLKARFQSTWLELTVAQIMSSRVLCFTAETTIPEVWKAFREAQHSRAAIVRGDQLIGQITRAALLRHLGEPPRQTTPRPKFLHSELARNASTLRQLEFA